MPESHYLFSGRAMMQATKANAIDQAGEDRFIRHFGMSSEQFQRELEAEFAQATPEEQAEFQQLVDQANAILPEMHATLDRIGEAMDGMSVKIGEMRAITTSLNARVGKIEDHFDRATGAATAH